MPKIKAMTRENLDRAQCDQPGCNHKDHPELVLMGACHPRKPTYVTYIRATGCLSITCGVCRQLVTVIQVADNYSHS